MNPPSESFEIQTYSRSYVTGLSFGSTMNAPSRPRPTWSVALWCEWYICEPAVRAVNSYVYVSPGVIGSWVTNGMPSWKKSSSSTPWKWTLGRLLEVVREDGLDLVALVDPDRRARPLLVVAEGRDRRLHLVDLLADLVDRQVEDLDSVLDLSA